MVDLLFWLVDCVGYWRVLGVVDLEFRCFEWFFGVLMSDVGVLWWCSVLRCFEVEFFVCNFFVIR